MRRILYSAAAFVCGAALCMTIAGCGQPASDQPANTEDEPVVETQRNEADPGTDGRIDVTTTGVQEATFFGPKYIVSDVTVDQQADNQTSEGLGLQEICVVDQPESWQQISSIGWDRNSISFTNVVMPWGTVSYRYEYINEASGVDSIEEFSRTTEEAFFGGYGEINHVEVDGHAIAYLVEDYADAELGMGIPDLEAGDYVDQEGASARSVSVYAYEQRADKCAFATTVTCQVTDEAAFGLTAEDIIRDAYAPLSFHDKDEQVDAASFVSDVAITDASGTTTIAIERNGATLIAYQEHSALLLEDVSSDDALATDTYDFATDQVIKEGLDEYEVGDFHIFAREEEGVVSAWTDVNGAPLYLETVMGDGEDVQSALERIAAGRITVL